VCGTNQRTGCFKNQQPPIAGGLLHFFRGPVRGDHREFRAHVLQIPFHADTSIFQFGVDGVVVNQFPKDGEGCVFPGLHCQINGILDPKAHAHMPGSNDFHRRILMMFDRWPMH